MFTECCGPATFVATRQPFSPIGVTSRNEKADRKRPAFLPFAQTKWSSVTGRRRKPVTIIAIVTVALPLRLHRNRGIAVAELLVGRHRRAMRPVRTVLGSRCHLHRRRRDQRRTQNCQNCLSHFHLPNSGALSRSRCAARSRPCSGDSDSRCECVRRDAITKWRAISLFNKFFG
jgi:hypothetical protein